MGCKVLKDRCELETITLQMTGSKKQSDEGEELSAVRVNLPC